jgi:hypothetical protein
MSHDAARRSFTVLGAGVAMTALLLSSGPAAFAKSDITMKANHKTVKAGKTIRFTGRFGDDVADGVNGDQVCLWQYVKGAPVRQLAPCVPLRKRNGKPLDPDSYTGYFTVTVKAKKPGRLTVVPVVKTSYDPKSAYGYARITIVVTRAAH